MVQENELITLILAGCVAGVFLVLRARIKTLPGWRTLLLAFGAMTLGWSLTLLEEFYWPEALNLLEHLCYTGSSILLALWCWQNIARRREETAR